MTVTDHRASTSTPISLLLSAAGVVALVLSLVLPWVDVNVDGDAGELEAAIDQAIDETYGSETPAGISLDDGPLLVIVIIVFVGALVLHHRRGRHGRALPSVAIVAALVATFIGVSNIADVGSTSDDLQAVLPVSIDSSIGLYLAVVGGLLALAGAVAAVVAAKRTD